MSRVGIEHVWRARRAKPTCLRITRRNLLERSEARGDDPKFRELEPDRRLAAICPALESRRLTLAFRIHRSAPEARQLVSNGTAPCGPPCSQLELSPWVSLQLGPS